MYIPAKSGKLRSTNCYT